MNYKEKYEMALERAKSFNKRWQCVEATDSELALKELKEIFPELKESEDEKIRKEIIAFIKKRDRSGCDYDYDKWLAWLEKQGKSSDQIHYWTEEEIEPIISDYLRGAEHYGGMIGRLRCLKPKSLEKQGNCSVKWQKNTPDNKPAINHSVLMKTVDGIAEGEWDGKYWHQYRWSTHIYDSNVLYWIELHDLDEQGEQKPTSDTRYEVKVGDGIGGIYNTPFDYEHATITQKDFAPKEEPKFKVGDWVVYECGEDSATLQIKNIVDRTYEFTDDSTLNVVDEDTLRLWSIKDAKDGDVLYSLDSYQPFIYKERKPFEQATAHCGINKYGKFFVWNTKDCIITLDKYIPATKEQRELLFKKMKEAGYEWDDDKKELKKIEQKQEWSEEDKKMYRMCIDAVEYYHTPEDESVVRDWLKSLKDRVKGKED